MGHTSLWLLDSILSCHIVFIYDEVVADASSRLQLTVAWLVGHVAMSKQQICQSYHDTILTQSDISQSPVTLQSQPVVNLRKCLTGI
jgi:hypothetical protein